MTEENTPDHSQMSGAVRSNGEPDGQAQSPQSQTPRRDPGGARPQGSARQGRPQGQRPPRPRPSGNGSTTKQAQPGQQAERPATQEARQPGDAKESRPQQHRRPGTRPPQQGQQGAKSPEALGQKPSAAQSQKPAGSPGQRGAQAQRAAQGQRATPGERGTQAQRGAQAQPDAQGQPGAKPDARPRPPRPASQSQQGSRPKVAAPKPEIIQEPEDVLLQYSVHEMARRPKIAFVVLAGIAVVAYFAWTAYPNFLFGVVSIAIMVFSVSAFLFPIRYKFTTRGVYFRNLATNEFRTWDKFYDYFVYKDALQLSFDYRTLRGRVQKGFLVYFDADQSHRDKVMEIVQSKIKKPEKTIKPPKPTAGDATPQDSNVKPAS